MQKVIAVLSLSLSLVACGAGADYDEQSTTTAQPSGATMARPLVVVVKDQAAQ